MHSIIRRYFWVIFLLAACSNQSSISAPTNVPSLTPPPPTAASTPMIKPSPTVVLSLTPTPKPLPLFPLDGYIVFFREHGDLYYQDGNNVPVKLIRVGDQSYDFRLSDDNQVVVVNDSFSNKTSIRTDGTHEKNIMGGSWSQSLLWGTEIGEMRFAPGTHKLIFSTHLCDSDDLACVSSLFSVDADSGEIKKLVDLGFSGPKRHENFVISPNGKMVAVMTTSSVDILGLDGKMIRHDILLYQPNTPDVIFPLLFWLPNSNGLIAALPNTLFDSVAYNYVSASTIWRYTFGSNHAVQIHLDPPPVLDTFQVSPDGNWIVYGGLGYNTEVYLGNLADGQTRIIGDSFENHIYWAPDSKHFLVVSAGGQFGDVDKPVLIPACPGQGGFIDANYFICVISEKNTIGVVAAGFVAGKLQMYDLGFDKNTSVSISPK